MIEIEIRPDAINVNQAIDAVFRLTNTNSRAITSVSLTLILPPQLLVIRGDQRIFVDRLLGNQIYEHSVRLKARETGRFQLEVTSLSYRSPDGEIIHRDHIPLSFTVQPAVAITMEEIDSVDTSENRHDQIDVTPDRGPVSFRATGFDDSSTITAGERKRLEAEWARLQERYDTASRRIAALDIAIDRALDPEHRQILEERRSDWTTRREHIAVELTRVEFRLEK